MYHLSAPLGRSINDFIDAGQHTLTYCTVGDAILIVHKLGRGALMAKIDLRNTFRLCPISKQDWHLLGVYWQHRYFINKYLPLELRSAPFI